MPDVATDSNSAGTGRALANSDGGKDYIVIGPGGTSASAPLWAGVIALADQYAGQEFGFVNPALCQIGRSTATTRRFTT